MHVQLFRALPVNVLERINCYFIVFISNSLILSLISQVMESPHGTTRTASMCSNVLIALLMLWMKIILSRHCYFDGNGFLFSNLRQIVSK